jgi:hypothetical protein
MNSQDLGKKWVPKDADALLDAFDAGFLEETHWCDLKRELTSNKETAKDMSSFSIDGGTIVIGLDEKKPNGEARSPVALKGLPEKIEQIAQWSVHPPLQISCTVVESGDNDGTGYVIVHIPPSPLAPHQVDSVYYARSDKTTIRMSEPEVERLYQRRAQWTRDAAEMLREHVDADPFGAGSELPRLFIVARPVGGWPQMCRDLVSGRDIQGKIKTLTGMLSLDTALRAARQRVGAQPQLSIIDDLSGVGRTARGAMLSSRMMPPSLDHANPEKTTDLEISEDGEMRFYRSGVGWIRNRNYDATPSFWLEYTVRAVREVIVLAREISTRYGHAAMWDLGIAVTSLAGARPELDRGQVMDRPGYPNPQYTCTTRASVLELEKTPGGVADRLVGRLYRTFNMEEPLFMTIFDDES